MAAFFKVLLLRAQWRCQKGSVEHDILFYLRLKIILPRHRESALGRRQVRRLYGGSASACLAAVLVRPSKIPELLMTTSGHSFPAACCSSSFNPLHSSFISSGYLLPSPVAAWAKDLEVSQIKQEAQYNGLGMAGNSKACRKLQRASSGLLQMRNVELRIFLEVADRHAVESSKRLQFYEIDPALAGLTLGQEGLRLLEGLGGLHLGQTGLQPRFLEPEPELGIGGLVVGGFQGEPTVRPYYLISDSRISQSRILSS
jgi:hypothetical protein